MRRKCDPAQILQRVCGLQWVNSGFEAQFGWGAKRFSIPASGGVHEARVRLVRRVGTKGPESFVKLRLG